MFRRAARFPRQDRLLKRVGLFESSKPVLWRLWTGSRMQTATLHSATATAGIEAFQAAFQTPPRSSTGTGTVGAFQAPLEASPLKEPGRFSGASERPKRSRKEKLLDSLEPPSPLNVGSTAQRTRWTERWGSRFNTDGLAEREAMQNTRLKNQAFWDTDALYAEKQSPQPVRHERILKAAGLPRGEPLENRAFQYGSETARLWPSSDSSLPVSGTAAIQATERRQRVRVGVAGVCEDAEQALALREPARASTARLSHQHDADTFSNKARWSMPLADSEGRETAASGRRRRGDGEVERTLPESDCDLSAAEWFQKFPEGSEVHDQLWNARRSATKIFQIVESEKGRNFAPINTSMALYLLSKQTTKASYTQDLRFQLLIDKAGLQFREMNVASLCNTLSALLTLRVFPKWLASFLEHCLTVSGQLSLKHVSICLNALRIIPFPTAEMCALHTGLVQQLDMRLAEVRTTSELCSLAIGLRGAPKAYGNLSDKRMLQMANLAIRFVPELDFEDLACIAWAFTHHAPINPGMAPLFNTILERAKQLFLLQEDQRVNPQAMASLIWALGVTQTGDEEFYRMQMSPILRRVLPIMTARQLVNIPWAYARNEVVDEALMQDVLSLLGPKIPDLTALHIADLFWSFKKFGIAHDNFFYGLADHGAQCVAAFRPNHVPPTLVGMAHLGVQRDHFFWLLWEEASRNLQQYGPSILLNLLEALCVSQRRWPLESPLGRVPFLGSALGAWDSEARDLEGVNNCVQLLKTGISELSIWQLCSCYVYLETLRRWSSGRVGSGPLWDAIVAVVERLHNETRSTWNLTFRRFIHLVAASVSVSYHHSPSARLLEVTLSHAATALKEMPFADFIEFLGYLQARGSESAAFRLFVSHIHRRARVRGALETLLQRRVPQPSDSLDFLVEVAFRIGSLGIEGNMADKWYQAALERLLRMEDAALCLPNFSALLVTYTQLHLHKSSVEALLKEFLEMRYGTHPADSFVPLTKEPAMPLNTKASERIRKGNCVVKESKEKDAGFLHQLKIVLNGYKQKFSVIRPACSQVETADAIRAGESVSTAIRQRRVEKFLKGEYHEAFTRLAWVCVASYPEFRERYVASLMQDAVQFESDEALPQGILHAQQVALFLKRRYSSKEHTWVSEELKAWVDRVLLYIREDAEAVPVMSRGASEKDMENSRFTLRDFPYTVWISDALTKELNLRHKVQQRIDNVYNAPIVFPQKKVVIDVLDFQDVSIPATVPLSTAQLRHQQLLEGGWTVVRLHLTDIYYYAKEGRLGAWLGEKLKCIFPEVTYSERRTVPTDKQQ